LGSAFSFYGQFDREFVRAIEECGEVIALLRLVALLSVLILLTLDC
jgi:hypothetical protein